MGNKKEPRFESKTAALVIRLKEFLEKEDPQDYTRNKIKSLLDYHDRDAFLTMGHWKFAENLMEEHYEAKAYIEVIRKFVENGVPVGYAKEKLMEVVARFDNRGEVNTGNIKFAKKLVEQYDEYEKDKKLIAELATMFDAGEIPDKAQRFVARIADWFEEKHMLTKNQREQAEHIRHHNSREVIVEE